MLNQLWDSLLDNTVDSTLASTSRVARRRWFRLVGRVALLLLLAWVTLATLFFWRAGAGTATLWQEIARGAPPRIAVAPVLAALFLLLALFRLPGSYWLAAYGVAALALVVIGAVIAIYGSGKVTISLATSVAILAALVADLIAFLLAFGDFPPLTSPLAPVAYLGRYRHLKALAANAAQRGWAVRTPETAGGALEVRGNYSGREVFIRSRVSYRLSSQSASTYTLAVAMAAHVSLWQLRIATGAPTGRSWHGAVHRRIPLRGLRAVQAYLCPPSGLNSAYVPWDQIEAIVKSSAAFLPVTGALESRDRTLVYSRRASLRLTPKDADLDPVLVWLIDAVARLEHACAGGPAQAY
jgi:hypothetical protein